MKHAIPFLLILSLLFFSCENEQSPDLDKQIAQMLLVGFRGTEIDETNHIVRDIEQYDLGGVILYEKDGPTGTRPRNILSPNQVKKLVTDLKSLSGNKLIVAIDEEGGAVDRLKSTYGFPATVSAQYLGQIDNEDSTSYYAASIASTLRDMGINLNFAPVLDLNINPESPAIGALGRSFSPNWDDVVKHSSIFIQQHDIFNVLTCCKHFPGHGSAATDSHLGLTDITETWSGVELQPYKSLIGKQKCKMIMSAHVFNLDLDKDYPATLSKNILTGLLRESLAFDGVIVSDAMEMQAISDNYGRKEAIMLAINAGCDILVFSNNIKTYNENIVPETIALIHELVDEGKITSKRINESYNRIMSLKSSLK